MAPEGWGQGSSLDLTQREELKLWETVVGSLGRLKEVIYPLLSSETEDIWFCINKSACDFLASSWTPTFSVQDLLQEHKCEGKRRRVGPTVAGLLLLLVHVSASY